MLLSRNIFQLTAVFFGVAFLLAAPARAERFHTFEFDGVEFQIGSSFSKSEEKALKADLQALREIPEGEWSTPLHLEVFGGSVSGKVYFKWLSDRIRYFGKGKNKTIRRTGFPFVAEHVTISFSRSPEQENGVLLYKHYFEETNQMKRLSVLIHEAKHAEEVRHHHVECPRVVQSFSSDRMSKLGFAPVCDRSWDGAYGAELIFMFNVTQVFGKESTGLNPKNSLAAGRIFGIDARCELHMDFWPETFTRKADCL